MKRRSIKIMGGLKPGNVGRFQTPRPCSTYGVLRTGKIWQRYRRYAQCDGSVKSRVVKDRYHITSLTGAKRILKSVRSHWGIENELHWTLDLAFDEDRCRVRKDHGPENFALLRHIALNLLKQEKTCKRGIKGKRLLAGWNHDYLLKVIAGLALMRKLRCVCPGCLCWKVIITQLFD